MFTPNQIKYCPNPACGKFPVNQAFPASNVMQTQAADFCPACGTKLSTRDERINIAVSGETGLPAVVSLDDFVEIIKAKLVPASE